VQHGKKGIGMRYSYIAPRKKSALTAEVQLLFAFFSVTFFMLFTTYAFLLFKDYRFTQEKESVIAQRENLEVALEDMKKRIVFIQKEQVLAEKVFTGNVVLKDSIANLFDLVPQRITLSQAQILQNGLILYGVTPNKDVYNFMLHAPLRSIFHRSYSSFYPEENGWLRFVSTNYIDEEKFNEN
jgi:hypothetical protein